MTDTIRTFPVPDLGEGLEEVTIVEWFVESGDLVELNQLLCTVETAKAEVEIPSPFAGTIVERVGAPGETLSVGLTLVRIDTGLSVSSARQPVLVGYGVDEAGDRSHRPVRRAPAVVEPPAQGTRPLAKPPVRKLARSLGVNLSSLARGSGPGGVITRADIFAASAPTTEASDEVILLRGIRARIADRMTTSRSRIPDATCSVEVDCSRLVEVRATLDGVAGESCHITPFALLCRLLVLTLRHHPILNATFVDDTREIRVHRAIHLGVATATDRGLVVPVVRDAHQLSTAELAGRITDLAAGARAGTLAPADLTGSTFTVSNFGAFGLDDGVPVINHPEAAIVGIGAIKPRPLVVDGKVVARLTARVTCAFDHRVCDGAEAGAFLAALRKVYESPELGLLDA